MEQGFFFSGHLGSAGQVFAGHLGSAVASCSLVIWAVLEQVVH